MYFHLTHQKTQSSISSITLVHIVLQYECLASRVEM